MTLQQRATEIPELVRRLGSRRSAVVDAARARLSIIGARAVEALIAALEEDDSRIRTHAMPLLALIQDPRGREPLVAMLLDRDPRMREIAARCLGRFSSPDAAAALERHLEKEKRPEVRVATVHALLQQYAAGHEDSIRKPLALVSEPAEDPRVRIAAMALVSMLRSPQRRALLRRLRQDPSPEVARKAAELEGRVEAERSEEGGRLRAGIAALASEDYAVWNAAVHRLAGCGSSIVQPLVAEMQRRAHDPEFCTRAGMALKALGPRRGRALAELLDGIYEPLPLQVLVEVVGALGEKSLIYRLNDLIERVSGAPHAAAERADGFDPMHRVRAKAHLELARVGSRVAIQDLRRILSDPDQRVEIEVLAAVELIGKRDEIVLLLRAHHREDRFVRERIARVIRSIMRRERIRRNDPIFRTLGALERRIFDSILAPASTRARDAAPGSRPKPLTRSLT